MKTITIHIEEYIFDGLKREIALIKFVEVSLISILEKVMIEIIKKIESGDSDITIKKK